MTVSGQTMHTPAPVHRSMRFEPAATAPDTRDTEVRHLFAELRGGSSDTRIRELIAERFRGLARHLAERYAGRGEPVEDLEQAALLGLVKAINGFDPSRGNDFIAYAAPMMSGEIKRHFRDRTWAVRVPRRHQERRAELNRVVRDLTHRLGRSPTMREMGEEMRMDLEELSDLVAASAAYSTLSLDRPFHEDAEESQQTLADVVGCHDPELEQVVDRAALPVLLKELSERERRIVLLRFYGEKTQSEIGAELGISQMHVSRLLSGALARMREGMLAEE